MANGGAKPAEVADLKRQFLEAFTGAPVSVAQAAQEIGRSARTIRHWALHDADFAEAYSGAKQLQGSLRLAAIEDLLFNRIMRGLSLEDKAQVGQALVIFWLKANGGDKWRLADKYYVEHSGDVTIKHEVDMSARIEHYRMLLEAKRLNDSNGDIAELVGD